MRLTKSWLKEVRSRITQSQAELCAIAACGLEALQDEHRKRYPFYIGELPTNPHELLRQLLYHDLTRIIPDVLID